MTPICLVARPATPPCHTSHAAQVASGAAAARTAPAGGGADEVDVIVVGAGVSGLTAALRLHQQGLSVLVLEARVR